MNNFQASSKRRNYFIDKNFQVRFISRFCLLVVFGGFMTIGIMYLLGKQSTTVSILDSRVVVRSTADFLLPILIQTFLIVVIIVGLAMIAVTLLASHKIVGPLYRFRKIMQALKAGDFSVNVNIRNNDQLQSTANEFNLMIEKLRDQINLIKGKIVKLKDKRGSISEQDIEELDKDIKFFKS